MTILANSFLELWASIPSVILLGRRNFLSLFVTLLTAFSREGRLLFSSLGVLLVGRKLTLSLAESCTATCRQLITEIPGILVISPHALLIK